MTSQVKILLVEDSPSDAALVEESLTQTGLGQFEFTRVETLAEAMRQARQTNFDVSLLDLTLPDSSGRETFLRARAEAPALPIVVMTSIADEAIGLEAVRHGIQDYLIKGEAYGRQTARSIRYAIERKRSEEALKQAEAALEQERAQLEEKVRERTADLSALNQALQVEILQRQRAEEEWLRLAAIVRFSEDAIASRDLNNVILTWNAAAEKLFGYAASEIAGRSSYMLVPPDRQDEARQIEQSVRQEEPVTHHDTVRVAKDGRHIPVSVSVSPIKDAMGKLVGTSAIFRDVTAEKEVQETLRRSEAALADFFDEAPLGLLWVDADGRIQRVNKAQLEMLGRADEEISGRPVFEFHAVPDEAAAALDRLAKKETLKNHHARLRHNDGSIRHVLIDANGLWEGARLLHSRWFVRDITERKKLERELLEIGERERQRIGQDLHDGLGQHLHGLSYLAALLEKALREDASPRAADAGQLNKYFSEALELIRGLAHGLQPVEPVPGGLMLALRELAGRTRGLYRMDCRFQCRSPVLIQTQNAATHLYRIAQEAVNNAMKHGKPTRIRIRLAATPEQIILGVLDNGVGIRQRSKPSKGMGLHIMQYRADAIGGSLLVQSHPQGGTEVVCTVRRQSPLKPEELKSK